MLPLPLRRYARPAEQVSGAEMILGASILILTAGIVTAFVYEVTTDQREPSQFDTAELPFPDPGVAGWRSPQRIFRYSRDNLYTKIDGGAEVYLQLGMVALTFGAYSSVDDLKHTVDVYWYDMGDAANALAVYRAEAAPGAMPITIGDEGHEIGGAVFFRKGASYVQVLPSALVEADAHAARGIAENFAAWITPRTQTGGK